MLIYSKTKTNKNIRYMIEVFPLFDIPTNMAIIIWETIK